MSVGWLHADGLILVEQAAGPLLCVLVEKRRVEAVDHLECVPDQPQRGLLGCGILARGFGGARLAGEHDNSALFEGSGRWRGWSLLKRLPLSRLLLG